MAPVASSFLIHWAADRIRAAKSAGMDGRTLPWLFGGPHISEPLLSRYRIDARDVVYPIGLTKGEMFVLCELIIDRIEDIGAFLEAHGVTEHGLTATSDLHHWLEKDRLGFLAPTCTDEAAIVRSATPMAFDRFLDAQQLASLCFLNAKGRRPISGVVEGRLRSSTNIQGHYLRLTEESAALLASVVRLQREKS